MAWRLKAIRDNETAAAGFGVDIWRTKLEVYVVTAALTSIIGGLIFLQKLRISPDAAFSVNDWTAFVIFSVVIGGIGTIEGPIIGTLVFLCPARNPFRLWHILPDDNGSRGDCGHAESSEGNLGTGSRPLRPGVVSSQLSREIFRIRKEILNLPHCRNARTARTVTRLTIMHVVPGSALGCGPADRASCEIEGADP